MMASMASCHRPDQDAYGDPHSDRYPRMRFYIPVCSLGGLRTFGDYLLRGLVGLLERITSSAGILRCAGSDIV